MPTAERRAPEGDAELEPWMTEPEAARYAGYSAYHFGSLRRRGVGPTYSRNGAGAVRYRRAELDAWMESGR